MVSPGPEQQSTKIIGQVYTVKFAAKEDMNSPKVEGHYVRVTMWLLDATDTDARKIDTVPANSILFISQPEPHINAVYGGLMSLRAQVLGAEGVIVDGRIRDVDEHRGIGFPVRCDFQYWHGNSTDCI